jgi:integrase/recombinase XerD
VASETDREHSIRLIESFQDTLWLENGLSRNTLKAYGSDLILFSNWLAPKPLVSAGRKDISNYLAVKFRQGCSARSCARLLSSLKRFFFPSGREGYAGSKPVFQY